MAKSMSVVVRPNQAALWPVSKSSLEVVPPKGMSRCVWASMPPGSSNMPEASMTRPAASAGREGAMSRIFSPSTRMSAAKLRSAVTTVPLRMSVAGIGTIIAEDDSIRRYSDYRFRVRRGERVSGGNLRMAPPEGSGVEGRWRLAHGHRIVLAEGRREPSGLRSGRLRVARRKDRVPRRRRPQRRDEEGQQDYRRLADVHGDRARRA